MFRTGGEAALTGKCQSVHKTERPRKSLLRSQGPKTGTPGQQRLRKLAESAPGTAPPSLSAARFICNNGEQAGTGAGP